ncbi:hypothetical protein [Couchioplanes azureus]|uniref:hypothetical protein n=1 Tax=Couchioplanes caeruleus TaxID=56438 RepID=UPI00166FF266|nr:hypothetical protein [Couchioplanes caeruleus]GGQ45542.1 hypothetical protein GCM10010166_12670 [Couchioplanes caeruleus subsp. azureus]
MSRQVRHRVAAIVVGGFLLGTAVATTGTANAEQAGETGRQVVFAGGGVLGLSCKSTPSVGSMTVPAESTVRVVNRTGHGANLLLNGASQGSIPDDGSTEVVFRRGTTAVMLDPSCAIADQATPVLVTATPSTSPATPAPMPSPSDVATGGGTATPSGPGTAPTTGGDPSQPDAGFPATRRPAMPGNAGSIVLRPGARPPAAAAPAGFPPGSMPLGGHAARTQTTTMRGTAEGGLPGMPPGGDKTLLPAVPSADLGATTEAVPAHQAGPATEIAAAEPVAAMRPMSDSRPIGLLALVAAIAVLGVTVGAIRAIVSQRASRATVA